MAVLSVQNLSICFRLPSGQTTAVSDVSLEVKAGETVALVGETGSGKSTIGNATLGLLPANADITEGSILFQGVRENGGRIDLANLPRQGAAFQALRGQEISMIFQEPMTALSPVHTIGDQISEVAWLHEGVSRKIAHEKTCHMLDRVGFPDPVSAQRFYPFELSGGMRQRAMIAMALVCRPALLVADEPTTALDVTVQAQILHTILELKEELGMAVLLITHDLGIVSQIADKIVVLHRGKVMEAGRCEKAFKNPQHPYLQGLLKAVPTLAKEAGSERLVSFADSRPKAGDYFKFAPPSTLKSDRKPIIEFNNLFKTYRTRSDGMFDGDQGDRTQALNGVSLTLQSGECLGLVGESGSGKTTLCRTLMRSVPPDSGDILFNQDGGSRSVLSLQGQSLKDFRKRIQYVFQDPFSSLNPRMTVCDIISEPLKIHKVCGRAEQVGRVAELMRLVGLNPQTMDRYPHAFSGGQRQRIGIARALALQPEILVLDEPVSSLDVSVQAQILNLMKDLKDQLGLTYLFISHNLGVIHYLADRVAVMVAGNIVEIAPAKQLFENPTHPYTRSLLAAVPSLDPDLKSDFSALALDATSDPRKWPAPYTATAGAPSQLVETSPQHFVAKTTEAAHA